MAAFGRGRCRHVRQMFGQQGRNFGSLKIIDFDVHGVKRKSPRLSGESNRRKRNPRPWRAQLFYFTGKGETKEIGSPKEGKPSSFQVNGCARMFRSRPPRVRRVFAW